jgi:hypothetical protein
MSEVETETLDEIARRVGAELIGAGVPVEVAKAFVCFRFHPHCPWGLGKIKFQDIEAYAIVRPTDEEMKNVECVFITTAKDLPLSDLTGLEVIPERSQLN